MTYGPAGFHRVEFAYAHGFFEKEETNPFTVRELKIWVWWYVQVSFGLGSFWVHQHAPQIEFGQSQEPTLQPFS